MKTKSSDKSVRMPKGEFKNMDIIFIGILTFVLVLTIGFFMDGLSPDTTAIAMRRLIIGILICVIVGAVWAFIERARLLAVWTEWREQVAKRNMQKRMAEARMATFRQQPEPEALAVAEETAATEVVDQQTEAQLAEAIEPTAAPDAEVQPPEKAAEDDKGGSDKDLKSDKPKDGGK